MADTNHRLTDRGRLVLVEWDDITECSKVETWDGHTATAQAVTVGYATEGEDSIHVVPTVYSPPYAHESGPVVSICKGNVRRIVYLAEWKRVGRLPKAP